MAIINTQKQSFSSQARKIVGLSLIFAFLAGLVFTNQPVSASPESANNPFTASASAVSHTATKPAVVTVVSLQTPAAVKVASASSALSCILASAKNGVNLVQDEGAINLNQPANCFSLQSASQAMAAQTLTVENLKQTATIRIAYSGQSLQAPNLVPLPIGPSALPSLPALSFTVVAAALVLRKKISQRLLNLREQFLLAYQAYGLQILRC